MQLKTRPHVFLELMRMVVKNLAVLDAMKVCTVFYITPVRAPWGLSVHVRAST